MFNKESQYISVVKYNNQLKIDYKKVDDGQTVFGKESTFIVYDETLPKDIAAKLNTWQKAFVKSYMTALCLDKDEKLVSKIQSKKHQKSKNIAYLNSNFDLITTPSKIQEVKDYYAVTGVDYIFSPFHILWVLD